MKSIKKVYVNPVPRTSVQGRHKQTYQVSLSSGDVIATRAMNKTKENGVGSTLQFVPNFRKNRLTTSLDDMIDNPYKDYDIEELRKVNSLSAHWTNERLEQIVKSEKIKKQTYFELLSDVEEGSYTTELKDSIFTTRDFRNIPKPTELQKFKIVLYDRPNPFTNESPRGRLAIELIQNHPKIAKNKTEINSAIHDFYISQEDEEAMDYNKRQDQINEAIYNLVKLDKEGTEYEQLMVATLLTNHQGKHIVKGEVNSVTLKKTLNQYVNTKGNHQLENANKFKSVVKLLDSREGRVDLHIKYLIQLALNNRVFIVSDGYYIWVSKKDQPSVYKFKQKSKLETYMKQQLETYNPDDLEVTNWYGELLEEVKIKGAKIETA